MTAQNVISTPTDRSMPEVMMMKVLATASTPMTVVDCRMPMTLSCVMNASGLSAVNTRINAIRLAKASSFCFACLPGSGDSQDEEEDAVFIAWP